MKVYTATITEAGKNEIARILTMCGKKDQSVEAWATEIEQQLENDASKGNNREAEMRGLRDLRGYTVFFDGENPEFVTYNVEEIDD